MTSIPQVVRFSNTPIILRQPLLVGLTVAFVLALVATQFESNPSPTGGYGWVIGVAILMLGGALLAWLLCSSQEVVIDANLRQVRQTYRFLHVETARNQWDLTAFTAVLVEQKTHKQVSAATSPGSGWAKTSSRTQYTSSYKLCLVRADTPLAQSGQPLAIPHHPLELPMDTDGDPLTLEALARQVAALGSWPARRRGYEWLVAEGAGSVPGTRLVRPFNGESSLGSE